MRSTVAHLFPDSQQYVNNGYAAPTYAWHCLNSHWGMIDVLHEEVARADGLDAYRGLLLLGTELLRADMVPIVDGWLRAGGVLIYDRPLAQNERGEAISAPWEGGPDAGPKTEAAQLRGLPYTTWQYGEGRVIAWGFDANELYRDAVENDHPEEAARLREALAAILQGAGLHAPAAVRDGRGQMEIGLRGIRDTVVAIALNHDAERNEGRVGLSGVPFVPELICDLGAMRAVEARTDAARGELGITLEGRSARMLALYASEPEAAELTARPARARGDSEVVCELAVTPASGCHLVEVEAADAKGQPIPWLARSLATEGGRARFALPIARNEPKGKHTVTASVPTAGLTATASFVVQ
jgi:hypothetical protein